MELHGKISDRIRAGLIEADPLAPRAPVDNRPAPEAVRNGEGRALGDPTRSDPSASWKEG